METTVSRDCSVSLIRLFSTVLIVCCHMMQYCGNELAWWFNVGVQVFFCLSGYLYGQKQLDGGDDLRFLGKQFGKILLDYYLVLIPMIALYFLFAPDRITPLGALEALLTYKTLVGGGHLWFIPYILFCYVLTPFLARYFDSAFQKNDGRLVARTLGLLLGVLVLCLSFFDYFNSAWLNGYVIGFFLGRLKRAGRKTLYRNISVLIVAAALLMNGVQVFLSYVPAGVALGIPLPSIFCNYAHTALGCALLVLLLAGLPRLFRRSWPSWLKAVCATSDKLSYDVYLVHHWIVLGPFSLMALTPSLALNILIIVAIFLPVAAGVRLLSSTIRGALKR